MLFRQQGRRPRLFQGFPAGLGLGLGGSQHLGFLCPALGFPLGGRLLGRTVGFRREFFGEGVRRVALGTAALGTAALRRDRRREADGKSDGRQSQQSRRLAHAVHSTLWDSHRYTWSSVPSSDRAASCPVAQFQWRLAPHPANVRQDSGNKADLS